ncbi:ABC transporter ATP-binding protein [Micromonospora sp. M51]|uniref:ABC transporter ATP-binding protein n=1 Tax=Micromonospora parva TaxID=1464048 RepID=A0ABW6VT23_9ACTN|nr:MULTISPECIES: ABC transporter ATP-binding protein [Micromonospora]MBQ1015051.1 ABC transporter ATP-binding protein [Micromonospora sp. M51]MBQ1029321.1 ABC transporter ATP-binding protein [Micromonospora sp. C97]
MSSRPAPTASTTTADDASDRLGLVMRGVSLRHGNAAETVQALDNVDLTVRPGELAAVVGPSGAGKSSLLAVAGGLARPDQGTVTVAGQDMTVPSRRTRTELRRQHVGFVFQSGNLLPALTAADQVRLPLRLGSRSQRSGRDPLELLADVGMADKSDRRPHQLSGGERQRVGIARALVTEPSVLLVDEPTAALDRARSHEIVRLLAHEARQRSVAVVMVTHDHDVLQYCDTVYEMVDGKLATSS